MIYPWQQAAWQQWLSQSGHLGHAYLLSGTAGIGLTEFAEEMAAGLLCQQPGLAACGQCPQCHQFAQATHPDVFRLSVLEDKKEISVDQVRGLTEQLYRSSHQGGYKVALIEEVERLNHSAFNALLKTLEEPPERTLLILVSYHASRLPATILSRCRKLSFVTPPMDVAMTWLHLAQPQADEALLKKSLRVNWGAPLTAKTWIEDKGFEFEAEWQQDLKALRSGKQVVSQVVEKWLKHDQPDIVFDFFYLWSVMAIRAALYNGKVDWNPNWMVFQKLVLQAKQVWQQNANKELLMESVCLAWLQHQQGGFNPKSPIFEALKGTSIRGTMI